MKIDLTIFEQQIDPTILKRGLQYYKKGTVDIISHTSQEVTANVEGTEDYSVTLHLNGDIVEEAICTCPYDWGAVCKHTVAVIFAIKAEELSLEVKESKTPSKPRKTKVQKESEEITEILQNASAESLAHFIEILCKENREVRQLFLAKMRQKSESQSKSDYKSSLSAYAQSLKRRGFIEYRDANKLGNAFYEVCDIAKQRFELGDYISAANAATAVIEQANAALDYTDDSSGCIGGPIDVALDLLYEISAVTLDEKSRVHLLKYCTKTYKKETFKGWDWHEAMLSIAIAVVKESKEIEEVGTLIEKKIEEDKSSWSKDRAKEMMAGFIAKKDGDSAARKYKTQNLDVLSFRFEAVDEYMGDKEYNSARKLVDSALKKDMGYESRWLDYQFRLELITGTKESIVALTRSTLLSVTQEYETYYRKLKELVAKEQWLEFRKELYQDIAKHRNYSYDKTRRIAIWEEDWDTYLKLIEQSEHFNTLADAESVLPTEYRPQIVEHYIRVIRATMSHTYQLDRKMYQKVTQAMRRMKKIGGISEANALVEELRAAHPKRKALLEELTLV